MTSDPAKLDAALDPVVPLLASAERILFVTGAGISADSGLPTYRGVGGLYEDNDTEEGILIEEALSDVMLESRPELTWKYLWQIASACRGARFNRGHEVIREIECDKPGTWVLTQNVDGFHRAAGSVNLIEIHGGIEELYCTSCAKRVEAALYLDLEEIRLPPLCEHCGGVLRPDVVLFGEMLPEKATSRLVEEMATGFDLVFTVGTTGSFPYILQPIVQARSSGRPTVEINPSETLATQIVDHVVPFGAAETLDRLWERVRQAS